MMNIFELHDFLHGNVKADANLGDPFTPTLESVKIKGEIGPSVANTLSDHPGNSIPWKTITIAAGITVLAIVIFDTFLPRNNDTPNFCERRRLARQKSSSQN